MINAKEGERGQGRPQATSAYGVLFGLTAGRGWLYTCTSEVDISPATSGRLKAVRLRRRTRHHLSVQPLRVSMYGPRSSSIKRDLTKKISAL
jgi:hypothetical protein